MPDADQIDLTGPDLVEPGVWVRRIGSRVFASGSPALFLDRDGTLMIDTGYPRDPAEVGLLPDALPMLRNANRLRLPVVIVTNQSGVARGLLGWKDFAKVTERLLALLAAEGCLIDLVIACGYHEAGQGALGIADHPMRKPRPGMLLLAGERLALDLARSAIVGDSASDMAAGRAAGLACGFLIGGKPEPASDFPVKPMGEAALRWLADLASR